MRVVVDGHPTTIPPSGAGISVRAAGVRHVYPGGVEAIGRVDLDVAAGEFLAILGPSGCGKSTLLRLIAGLDRPTEGTVDVGREHAASVGVGGVGGGGGTPILPYAPRGRRTDVAYVFQDAHLLPWRTVLHNAALPLELHGAPAADRLAAAARALAAVGLAGFEGRYPAQLSGGMRMRVSIARALVTRPRLLLMDEPFAALDEITRQRLDEELRRLWADTGMTVVFVTHSTQEATFLANRAVVMSGRPGRVVLDHPIDLPHARSGDLRADVGFAQHTRVLYDALERGDGVATGAGAAP
jgi:NitT/TauT family transport system ATP-binding protein